MHNKSLFSKSTTIQNLCSPEPNLGKLAFKNQCDLSMNFHRIGWAFPEVCVLSAGGYEHVSVPSHCHMGSHITLGASP